VYVRLTPTTALAGSLRRMPVGGHNDPRLRVTGTSDLQPARGVLSACSAVSRRRHRPIALGDLAAGGQAVWRVGEPARLGGGLTCREHRSGLFVAIMIFLPRGRYTTLPSSDVHVLVKLADRESPRRRGVFCVAAFHRAEGTHMRGRSVNVPTHSSSDEKPPSESSWYPSSSSDSSSNSGENSPER
jgi:hypothetical protein